MATVISLRSWIGGLKNILSKDYLYRRLNWRFLSGVLNRLSYERRNPDVPWLTAGAVRFLKENVKKNDVYLEFGSGQSTVWFANRVKKIYSVEHDAGWYEQVREKILKKANQFVYLQANTKIKYLEIVEKIKDGSVDVCLVDGNWRRDCMLAAIPKIKVGGVLILDNAETFLPVSWESVSVQRSWEERGCQEKNKVKKITDLLVDFIKLSTTEVSQDTVIWIRKA